MLMALLVQQAMPKTTKAKWQPLLETLGYRMGRNREIAGLHYPSDSVAGRKLAWDIKEYIVKTMLKKGPLLALLDLAKAEWPKPSAGA